MQPTDRRWFHLQHPGLADTLSHLTELANDLSSVQSDLALTVNEFEPPAKGMEIYDEDTCTWPMGYRIIVWAAANNIAITAMNDGIIYLSFIIYTDFILVENIFDTNRSIPALANCMVRNPCLGVATDCRRCGECSIALCINSFILQYTTFGDIRFIFGYTPTWIKQVHGFFNIETELQRALGGTNINFEVVLVAEINTMNPWRVDTVSPAYLPWRFFR